MPSPREVVDGLIDDCVSKLVAFLDDVDQLRDAGIDLTVANNNNLNNGLLRFNSDFGSKIAELTTNSVSSGSGRLTKALSEEIQDALMAEVSAKKKTGISSSDLKEFFTSSYPQYKDKWASVSQKLKQSTNYTAIDNSKPNLGGTFKP